MNAAFNKLNSAVALAISAFAILAMAPGCKPKAPAPPPPSIQNEPPRIVSTSPEDQSREVDPSVTEITVTFDRDMEGGMSWTGGGADLPASPEGGQAHWLPDKRTCVLPVTLEPGRHYRVGINSPSYQNFRSVQGLPAVASAIVFTTKGTAPSGPPRIVSISPPNHSTDVDPSLTEVRVTFDRDMEEGMSWTGGGPELPASPEGARAHWLSNKRTCVLPVKLEPGRHYRVGINSPSYRNFRSAQGVPVVPTAILFTTKRTGSN